MFVLQDLRFGARMLRKNPIATVIALVTLALGIGANTAAISTMTTFLLDPLPYDDPDRIVALSSIDETLGLETALSPRDVESFKEECRSFESIAPFQQRQLVVAADEGPESIKGLAASPELLHVLRLAPTIGRAFVDEDTLSPQPGVALISYGCWQRRFGGATSTLGRTLVIDRAPVTIVGVLPERLQFPSRQIDVWIPLSTSATTTDPDSRSLAALARLAPGMSVDNATSETTLVASRVRALEPIANSNRHYTVTRLDELAGAKMRERLLILQAAVAFVLLVACANVASLLLARAAGRTQEVAIRAAVGAGRGRLVRQFLAESLLLALLGGALALPVARWLLDLLVSAGPERMASLGEVQIDGRAFAVTLGISLLCGAAFGLAPALGAARTNAMETLKRGASQQAGFSGGKALSGLVVFEVALSLMLLVGAGLLARAYMRLEDVAPGFDARSGLAIDVTLPDAMYKDTQAVEGYWRDSLERLRALPGVESAGAVDIMPLIGWNPGTGFETEGRAGTVEHADLQPVTAGYIEAMGIPLMRGRLLTERESAPVALVNDRFARKIWPNDDAVGHRIRLGGATEPWRTIVGVVGDVRQFGVQFDPRPEIYVPDIRRSMTIVLRTRHAPADLVRPALGQLEEIDPGLPRPFARTLESVVTDALSVKRLGATTFGVLAAIAVLLAAMGLFGVVSFSAARRTHEIGIRMALGARPSDVVRLVVGQSLTLTALGVALGLLGSLAVTRFLRSMLFGVSPLDVPTFAAACALMLLTALVAGWLPARRSVRVDPMRALQHD
jgi:putative ABC transport system permease protein